MRLFRAVLTLGVFAVSALAQDGKEKHAYQVCIATWLALNHETSSSDLHTIITRLSASLETFPTIAAVFTVPGQNRRIFVDDEILLKALKQMYVTAGLREKELFEEPKSKRQRKREKKRAKNEANAQAEVQVEVSQQLDGNLFAILDQTQLPDNR